jgi:hypothetical protein
MYGARRGSRTPDILITNQVLYQLSYAGKIVFLRLRSYRVTSLSRPQFDIPVSRSPN